MNYWNGPIKLYVREMERNSQCMCGILQHIYDECRRQIVV